MTESPWLGQSAAVKYLGRKNKTAVQIYQRLCRRGKIKASKKFGEWYTKREYLDDFMARSAN